MTQDFRKLMAEATRLTRAGRLEDAMRVLRGALLGRVRGEHGDDAAEEPDTIDVEARVREEPARPHAAAVDTGTLPVRDEAPATARDPGTFTAHRYTGPAGARTYKLFVPPSRAGRARGLVVMLHGCKQDPDDFARGTRMNEHAAALGWLVAYPEQSRNANGAQCWNWFRPEDQTRDAGEPAILAGLAREIAQAHDIDPGRVFIAGLSAGGAMAVAVGKCYPDVFAAIGVHSGVPAGAAHDVPSAFAAMRGQRGPRRGAGDAPGIMRPTIVFHGDRDDTVHPNNGLAIVKDATPPNVHVETSTGDAPGGRRYTRTRRCDANGVAVVDEWIVHGLAHAWSGGSEAGSYADPSGPDASAAMLDFFVAHAGISTHA